MGRHLSLRLPWHDRGWDGHVCDRPTANVYCSGEFGLKAHEIGPNKDDAAEEKIKGKPCHALPLKGYLPPCRRTIQTFGGTKPLPWEHAPRSFLATKTHPIDGIPEPIQAFTSGTWPYDGVFRKDDAGEEVPDEFQDRYSPEEALENIEDFFAPFKPKKSLVFYYLNYDNPLNSESRRYVLVGAAEIDAISKQHEWEGMDPKIASVYGTLVWNRFVTSGFGEGRGARLPYEKYIEDGRDPSGILLEIPAELSRHFKYVCRRFTDDEAAILLRELIDRLERGRDEKSVRWDWDAQITWANKALDSVWKERGVFPGLGPVLEALGFPRATLYLQKHVVAKGVKDPRTHVLDRLDHPRKAEDADAKKGFEIAGNTLKLMTDAARALIFDRLALFELTTEQMTFLIGGGLVQEDARKGRGLVSTAAQLHENPYLIIEEYLAVDADDRIPFHRIDNGMFLAKVRGGTLVPDLSNLPADDKRRVRAAAVDLLRHAEEDGHSFLLQDALLAAIARIQLPGLTLPIGMVVLARNLTFYQQRLSLRKEGEITAWQLREVAEDEGLIRERIAKMRGRKACTTNVSDWAKFLPPTPGALRGDARATMESARSAQAIALEKIARRPLSVLIGGAGTGKTTVLGALIKALDPAKSGEKFVLLTPTGKAAVRLRRKIFEVAGVRMEPRTIHSYLLSNDWMDGATYVPRRDGKPVQDSSTTVIIDESSMLDLPILATIFRALDWTKIRRLILCGDPQQLPPIGSGAPFKNLVDTLNAESKASLVSLEINCRQVQESSAALLLAQQFAGPGSAEDADELLDRVRLGGRIAPDLEVRFFGDEHELGTQLEALIWDALPELLSLEGLDPRVDRAKPWEAFNRLHRYDGDIDAMRLDAFEVLSPYRGGYFGSDEINRQIQKLFREGLLRGWSYLGKQSGRRYVYGDKILQTKNTRLKKRTKVAWDDRTKDNVDHYVANGELGRLMSITGKGGGRRGHARFETAPHISVSLDSDWAQTKLELGYAMSVHKSQGSDFGGVVVVVPQEERQRLVSRELLYTALTRFTKRLYLLIQGKPGDVSALLRGLWLGSSDYLRRNTSLYLLGEAISDLEDFRPGERIHRTLPGVLVRSKSEALIATQLHKRKIPFHYELPLIGRDGSVRRPDFTIPIETPDGPGVVYWEHWGMRGDPTYDAKVRRRRAWYVTHGFADKLIETDEVGGIDQQTIERLILERLVQ